MKSNSHPPAAFLTMFMASRSRPWNASSTMVCTLSLYCWYLAMSLQYSSAAVVVRLSGRLYGNAGQGRVFNKGDACALTSSKITYLLYVAWVWASRVMVATL